MLKQVKYVARITLFAYLCNMKQEEARKKAVFYATKKGWSEKEISFLTKEGDTYVFNLYMPKGYDLGSPRGVIVNEKECYIRALTLQELLLLPQD